VLIPFIDENRLIGAMKDCESRIFEHERLRNRHGPMQIYVYTEQDLGQLEAPAHFSTIVHNHAQCQELSRDAFVVQPSKLIKGRHPKSTLDRYIPGFPSTRHLLFTVSQFLYFG
jgi:5'-3' exoribonuclease 1